MDAIRQREQRMARVPIHRDGYDERVIGNAAGPLGGAIVNAAGPVERVAGRR